MRRASRSGSPFWNGSRDEERGAISGDGGLAERARIVARLEADRAELELEEAELLKDATGAQTLADGWAVIDQASAAKARVEALGIGGMDLYHAHLADIDPKRGVGRERDDDARGPGCGAERGGVRRRAP